jgi:hypothetical protein
MEYDVLEYYSVEHFYIHSLVNMVKYDSRENPYCTLLSTLELLYWSIFLNESIPWLQAASRMSHLFMLLDLQLLRQWANERKDSFCNGFT